MCMCKFVRNAAMAALVAASSWAAAAELAAEMGAEVGKWTQDYDAAMALARERSLPVLVKFTGSNWCGWCKIMEHDVFLTEAFKKWAEGRVVLVTIDFPSRHLSIVPVEWRSRNVALRHKHDVNGYPTFIVFNSKGEVVGRLGASRNATVESFTKSFEELVGDDMPKRDSADTSH